jgi:ATP-dependent helicase/nuclease subunit A
LRPLFSSPTLPRLKKLSSTPTQLQAIATPGNVVLVAGAGTGKTHTLVERCLHCLLEQTPPASLDEILMVTFTEAAAAEMRQRIRQRLEEQLKRAPDDLRWQEQLALFESAHIGTLHSFCLQLVRQHFYELELDPNLAVLPEEEARLLAEETLDTLLQRHYAGETPGAGAVQELIQVQGGGSDKHIRALVLRLHHYTQTLPDPQGWFASQLQTFSDPEPRAWRDLLADALTAWRTRWPAVLRRDHPGNELASRCATLLENTAPTLPAAAATLQQIRGAAGDIPHGRKTACTKPLKEFLAETEFLASLTRPAAGPEPVAEDWTWVRAQMVSLLELAREFTAAFSETKRELGAVDFHDLEQHALRLLWDSAAGQPTRVGREWRQKLRFVFVDEYQDINAAQDKIIEALSRESSRGNRFLVGDVKQSIYRFRLADPHIFQRYAETWTGPAGTSIPLVDNFRSRESIIEFINSFFSLVMSAEIGGVPYDERARLRFGAPAERVALSLAASPERSVELHLRLRGGPTQPEFEEIMESLPRIVELREADKEARLVALRLVELKGSRHRVWDERSKTFRPVEWSDMAILLRSPSRKSESYAKEFSRLNVPLLVARSGFYDSLEILDLLSLLQVLDNPLQDIPLLALLHSPLAGLDIAELAAIRLAARGPFWKALLSWKAAQPEQPAADPGAISPDLHRKVVEFLDRFATWRRLARRVSLSHCLETVLSETHYASWLLAQPRGQQRHANVQRLLALARQFDRFQRQGLFRFLKFVEAQQLADTQPEVAPVCEENAVRLMSIHQSKGLEFPVAVVADLGKQFNLADLKADIILDERHGLCPQIKPPHSGRRYPSLPYWLARQRQLRETLGEEARLLYVAMTRAQDLLILTASLAHSTFTRRWLAPCPVTTESLSAANRFTDWLGQWFAQYSTGVDPAAARGQNAFLRWILHDDSGLLAPPPPAEPPEAEADLEAGPEVWRNIHARLTWRYLFPAATQQPAKTSVTTLRRQAAELAETVSFDPGTTSAARFRARPENSPADVGLAHHAFLERLDLDAVGSREQLEAQAQALARDSVLTAAQIGALDYDGLAAFWDSELGRQIRAQSPSVHRELVFTARFTPAELAELTGASPNPEFGDEFVVVQGVVDLAVIAPSGIWLIDFKTDAVGDLALKVRQYEPQLRLYARALQRIYGQPVTQMWLYFLSARKAVKIGD